MADDQVQKLYDEAFRHWQDKENGKARELIDEALRLAPNDLSLHALAVHIKRYPNYEDILSHAEFIVDHDVHYRDPLKDDDDPFFYVDLMMTAYSLQKRDDDEDADVESLNIEERHCRYATKILQAGREIPNLTDFMTSLSALGRYDDVINIGYVLDGMKSAAEIGLPGLDHCELDHDYFDSPNSIMMTAFYRAGRDEEALEWLRHKQQADPKDWFLHALMAEVLCRLNQPAESARQWIIAIQKGGHVDDAPDELEMICNFVADPQAGLKIGLWHRIMEVRETVSPDRKTTADKTFTEVHSSIGDPDKKLMPDSYIEAKLGVKLPPFEERHFRHRPERLWLPATQGPHPFVKPQKRGKEDSAVTPRIAPTKPVNIERFGVDLTEQAAAGRMPPIVGRDREIDALIRVLIRMEKNNPALIGEAGVGKTAIAQGLAQRIVEGRVPTFLRNRRVFELTMSSLVAGTTWRGDFEQRMTSLIKEARDNPDLILFIDELHTIMGAGAAGRGDLDAANMTKPALAKGELRLIGATTTQEYARRIEQDHAMARRFTPVRVAEMDRESTLAVLRRRREHWLKFHKVQIPDEVIDRAVEWTEAHVANRKLPDKAIDLLDESCAHLRTRMSGDQEQAATLSIDVLRRVLMEWTGAAGQTIDLPPEPTGNKTQQTMLAVPNRASIIQSLREHVVAQDEAVEALADVVTNLRMALKEAEIPTALLFYGPASTGKTTAAHALARTLWPDDAERLMTLNMGDYSDGWSLNRLIGAPLGYAQHEEGGLLTARLRRKPHSILLLKDLDAAHPRLLDFIGDLMRHGVYTDTLGRPVSARDAIFVIHVNTSQPQRQIGFPTTKSGSHDADLDELLEDLQRRGVPDRLLCGVSRALHFPPLSPESTSRVLRLRLDQLQRAFAQRGQQLDFTDALLAELTERYLALPADRRNIESLIDRHVSPLIRNALVAHGQSATDRITIGPMSNNRT